MAMFFYAIGVLSVALSAYGSLSASKGLHLGVIENIVILFTSCLVGIPLIGIGKILSNQENNLSALEIQIYELKNKIDEQEEQIKKLEK